MADLTKAIVAPHPSQYKRLPAEMRGSPQWAVAGANKAPLSVNASGKLFNASVTEPDQWLTYERALELAEQNQNHQTSHFDKTTGYTITLTGLYIGYVLSAHDHFACIDLDVKDDTPQEQLERFESVVNELDSYTEFSRSGRGKHIWARGKIGKGFKRDGIEVYSQERFIICTGNVIRDLALADRQEMLDNMVSQMRPVNQEVDLWGEHSPDWSLADRSSFDAGELGRLFRGEWEGRYSSQSEADFNLVTMLLPLCESPRECWETFRLSKLGKRDKARRRDYAQSTISRAAQRIASDGATAKHGRELALSILAGQQPNRFRLMSDADLDGLPETKWLVKRIIPDAGIGAIYGDSGTYKSFLTLDLLAHIANGQEWFQRKVKPAPAVYIPFEGRGGIPSRVKAWRLAQAHLQDPTALVLLEAPPNIRSNVDVIMEKVNLRDAADREKLILSLQESGRAGGVLCIDTLAHASNGIDENSSEMGEMINIFEDLQRRLGGVILVIHHSGKDHARGMRGWSGLHAAMDFVVECQRDKASGTNEAKFVLTKVKDGSDGLMFVFAMRTMILGFDEEGDSVTSLSVSPTQTTGEGIRNAPSRRTNKGLNSIDAETSASDDAFIDWWIREQIRSDKYPSKNSLKGQLAEMKEHYEITQDRVAGAVERLLAGGKIEFERVVKSPSGNVWLRAIELPQQVPPAARVP